MDQAQGGSPFDAAAPYYDRFRAPYPREALEYVVSAYGLAAGARVLDLGCGPGTIAIPLSRLVAEVVAVDPAGTMLAEARRLADAHGRRNIRWVTAKAEDIASELGTFQAVTMGQSFHWMQRDLVLQRLASFVEDGGGLALINPGKRRPQESWENVAGAVVVKYLGRRERHPTASREPEHEPSLARSGTFSMFTAREFSSEITRDVASIIGCLYSTTGAAKPLFGDNATRFEAELTQVLLRRNPSGLFKERIETEVVLAPRIL